MGASLIYEENDAPVPDYILDLILAEADPRKLHTRYYFMLDLFISFIFATYYTMCAMQDGLMLSLLTHMAPENWSRQEYAHHLCDEIHKIFSIPDMTVVQHRAQALALIDRELARNPPVVPSRAKGIVELVLFVYGLLKFPSFRQALAPVPPGMPNLAPEFKVTDYVTFESMLVEDSIFRPEPAVAVLFDNMMRGVRLVPSQEEQHAFDLTTKQLQIYHHNQDEDHCGISEPSTYDRSSASSLYVVKRTAFNINEMEFFAAKFATMYSTIATPSMAAIKWREEQKERIHGENHNKILQHVRRSGYQSMT